MNSTLQVKKSPAVTFSVVAAFAAIYIIWGSTYLAIRIVVATVPPFFAASLRFLLAGLVLFAWAAFSRTPMPSAREWRNLLIAAALLFVPSYGGLFWAEKIIPSGVASVLVATIPLWMAVMEIFVLKQSKLRFSLIASFLLGITGVAILTLRGSHGKGIPLLPIIVLSVSEITWCIGSLVAKNMQMPASKSLTAGAQMTLGGAMLFVLSLAAGELHPWPRISLHAGLALLYLAVAGSIVAFTAYLWLLARLPATIVASYAYVNPVVALGLGAWFGNEALDARVFIGTALVLAGVVLTLNTKGKTQPAH